MKAMRAMKAMKAVKAMKSADSKGPWRGCRGRDLRASQPSTHAMKAEGDEVSNF